MKLITTTAMLAALAVAAPAHAQLTTPTPGPAPGSSTVAEGPSVRFTWSMPARYARGWQAWDRRREAYDPDYVQPQRWAIDVDACTSSGAGHPITSYALAVRAADYGASYRGTRCRQRFAMLPRLGDYQVTVVVRTAHGTSAPRTARVTLRDHLIVSIGDSMASGEGVPDTPGLYRPPFRLTETIATLARLTRKHFQPITVRPARWQDRRCHRSARAGHALAAREIEARDPHSSVTFVSLACSGATIANLINDPQEGPQPPRGAEDVRPQLTVLRELVAARDGLPRRKIDAALLSVGINDLSFSDIVIACATNVKSLPTRPLGDRGCVYDNIGADFNVDGELEDRYAGLATALGDRLDIADVYITDYPGRPFGRHRGGCGLLGISKVGITGIEAEAIAEVGGAFGWAIGRATVTNGWNWVPGLTGVTEAFGPHHYCSSRPWFNTLESSILRQGTHHGAVHPNRAGHAALGSLLAKAIVLREPAPHWHARLIVEAVRVEDSTTPARAARAAIEPGTQDTGEPVPPPPASDRYGFDFGVKMVGNWPLRTERRFTIPKSQTGEWVAVPADVGVFEVDLYDAPRPPRYVTDLEFSAHFLRIGAGWLGARYSRAQGFGAGCHARVGNGWAVRYRIEVREVGVPTRPVTPDRPAAAACDRVSAS